MATDWEEIECARVRARAHVRYMCACVRAACGRECAHALCACVRGRVVCARARACVRHEAAKARGRARSEIKQPSK
jgi:hypothetical protein